MKKTVVLFAALASSMLPFRVSAAENSVNIHVTIAQKETVLDQDITVTDQDGDGRLTSEDAVITAHNLYYPGGSARGYAGEGYIWGLRGEYFYTNLSAGADFDPELHNPVGQRRDLRNGDSLTWEAGNLHQEMCCIQPQIPEHLMNGNPIPQGTEIRLAVSHLIPAQPADEPVAGAEITVNGKKTGIFTDADGFASLRLDQAGACIIGALTEFTGVPCTGEWYVETAPAMTENDRSALQNSVSVQPANAPAAQAENSRQNSVRRTTAQTGDRLPGFLTAITTAALSALGVMLFRGFRKLH